MDAIYLLKELETDQRQATTKEQEVLSRYVGWGGLSDAFDESRTAWAEEYRELSEALTQAEYEAARASTLNAHYTSPTVIRAIYEAVEQMGFTSGNILEPSCGVGNFFWYAAGEHGPFPALRCGIGFYYRTHCQTALPQGRDYDSRI